MTASVVLRPVFIASDPVEVQQECIDLFQGTLGKVLEPAQVERLLLNAMAFREATCRSSVQIAGEQNLIAFAVGSNLDALVDLVGCERMVGVHGHCDIRFTASTVGASDLSIPAGTRVKTGDGRFIFAVKYDSKIPAGQLFADIYCEAEVEGEITNGYAIGEVNQLIDPISGVASVSNVDATNGGVDTESDDELRNRARYAPYGYGSAGSQNSYKYHAMSVGPWVVDVRVTSPTPGNVQVAILTNVGDPTVDQLAAVTAALTSDTVRPITDHVTVVGASKLTYTIAAAITIYTGGDSAAILEQAQLAVEEVAAKRRVQLGLDITPSQILAAILSVPGIYDVTISSPAAPVVASDDIWLDCTGITLTIAGSANG